MDLHLWGKHNEGNTLNTNLDYVYLHEVHCWMVEKLEKKNMDLWE